LKLTAITITNMKPRQADYRRADGGGLYILVRPNGSKLWRYDYRLGNVRRTLSIGEYDRHGDGKYGFTLAQARDEHEKAKTAVARGEHPASQSQKAAADVEITESVHGAFGVIADDWLATRKINLSPKSHARDVRSVTYLKEGYRTAKGFGGLDVELVEPSHLSDLLEVFNKPTRIRVLSAAKKIMGLAKRRGVIKVSPFSDIDFNEGFAKHKVKHRPALTDPERFGDLLRKMDAYEGRIDNLTWYALRLLALTFVRPGTVAAARWAHIDLKAAMWLVPFEHLKMATEREDAGKSQDDYIIPLSRQAVALLRELHKISGESEYLFPGYGDGPTISENTINFALHGLGFKGVHCAHGFRSSASTLLNRERLNGRRRFERDLIEMQQDRLDASTRAVYDRDDRLPERIELMQFWADRIDEYRSGKPTKAPLAIVA
jgi:integrase